jgi:Flp pilus assembly protein TadB
MPEPIVAVGSIIAGASFGIALYAIAGRHDRIDAAAWLARRRMTQPAPGLSSARVLSKVLNSAGISERLVDVFDRAGWRERPERLIALAFAFCCCTAAFAVASARLMLLSGSFLGVCGFVIGIGCCALALKSAVTARRRRLAAELVPLLELFTLELSGGGSALSALGSVTSKIQGELAADLRGLLIASQVAGSVPFEARLMKYSEHLDIPSLASLATILGASRVYGTGVIQGVRALATDLRHAQRRELIAHSRRALNHVLIPAAVGVLLPFLAVVMFPAISALQRNFR